MITLLIKNATLKNGVFDILIKDGKISEIGNFDSPRCNVIDAQKKRVIPGLIDVHIHAFRGNDVLDGEDALKKMSADLGQCGTTSFLPTAMTASIPDLRKTTSVIPKTDGAEILGFHLEGPYISKAKKGAQNEAFIKLPDLAEFKTIKNVKKITVAPELDNMEEFIENADCQVSIGHTACDYETAIRAIDAGANCLTHTFNAMPPLLHRNPGPIGAAVEKNIYAEVICDGRHVAKPAVLALYKTFTADRLILISDCVRSAGLPDGHYNSGGLDVTVKNSVATLADGTLAGGSVPLLECVKTAVSFGIDFYDAVKAATETPAKSLSLNKGKIADGYDADLLILNDDFTLDTVIIGGKKYR